MNQANQHDKAPVWVWLLLAAIALVPLVFGLKTGIANIASQSTQESAAARIAAAQPPTFALGCGDGENVFLPSNRREVLVVVSPGEDGCWTNAIVRPSTGSALSKAFWADPDREVEVELIYGDLSTEKVRDNPLLRTVRKRNQNRMPLTGMRFRNTGSETANIPVTLR